MEESASTAKPGRPFRPQTSSDPWNRGQFAPIAVALLSVGLLACGRLPNPLERTPTAPPSLTFLTPDAAGVVADESTDIKLRFRGVSSGETWDLFYMSAAASAADSVIARNLDPPSAKTQTLTWETENLSGGRYYLYANLKAGGMVTTASAPGAVVVDHSGPGNESPSVSLVQPTGGETWLTDTAYEITWEASDPDDDDLSFRVELSTDSGSSWATLVESQGSSPYRWTPANVAIGTNLRIRVTAKDGNGGSRSAISTSDFTVEESLYWQDDIDPMLQDSCAGSACHSTGGDWASTFTVDDYKNDAGTGTYDVRDLVLSESEGGTMPPYGSGYPELTTAELSKLRSWIDQGAPKN